MVTPIGLLSEGMVLSHLRLCIIQAWMNLLQSWLVLIAFSVLLLVLWGRRLLLDIQISLNAPLGGFLLEGGGDSSS